MCQLTNETECKIPLIRGQFHCDHQKLNLLNKTLRTMKLCISLFFKRKLRFSVLSFPLALNLFAIIILFQRSIITPNHDVIFTLHSYNRHDHKRNIFSIRSSSLKHSAVYFFIKRSVSPYFYHIRYFDFQRRSTKLCTLRMKNHHSPFPFPIPTLRLWDTFPYQKLYNQTFLSQIKG